MFRLENIRLQSGCWLLALKAAILTRSKAHNPHFVACLILAGAVSCTPQPTDRQVDAEEGVGRTGNAQLALAQSTQVRPAGGYGNSEIEDLFKRASHMFAENGLHADRPDNPLLEMDRRWLTQFDRCGDAACRRSLTHDVRRRLSFGLGRSRGEIAGIPWRIGFFHSPPGEDGRQISILPLEGGRIVIRIDTVTLSGNWECQLIATGSIDDDGNGVMHLVGDPANWRMLEGEPGRFMLRTRSPTEIVIEPMQPSPETGFCRGSHMGEYRASTRLLRGQ